MISAVIMFGVLNVLFEFIVLGMVNPRLRLRLLGSHSGCVALHFACLTLNLLIHWGTLVGTMSGIFSFVCSIATVGFARFVWGYIEQGRYYKVGWVKYTREELK